jgi:hypothetical protein
MIGSIAQRLDEIRQHLPASVRLIAVTKQVSLAAMRTAYDAGIRDFGENRVQEAEFKKAQLQDLPGIAWHLIGHLQTNKARKALEIFDSIHSVDSLKLALHLDEIAQKLDCRPQILLQVKLLTDDNKYGWIVPNLLSHLPALDRCKNLEIQGLMTIPPLGIDSLKTLAVFEQTRELADTIRQQNWLNIRMQELSMGMSDDYQLAVKAGATMVRLGRIIFGERTV